MFLKKKTSPTDARTAPQPLSPRIVAADPGIVVAAGRRGASATSTLILATYTRSDPGFSYTGTSTAIANRGGVFGAWLADLLLYLFGVSAWWWVIAGIVAIVTSYRLIVDPAREREHPFVFVAHRLRAGAAVQRGDRGDAAVADARGAAARAGRRVRRRDRPRRRADPRLQRRDAAADRACSPSASRSSPACRGSR